MELRKRLWLGNSSSRSPCQYRSVLVERVEEEWKGVALASLMLVAFPLSLNSLEGKVSLVLTGHPRFFPWSLIQD
jgi:hypothetical protein